MKRLVTPKEYQQKINDILAQIKREVKPFEDDSIEARQARKERCLNDRLEFGRVYLPHYFDAPSGDCHREWLMYVDDEETPDAVAGPRDHGKSVDRTLLVPLHDVCYGLKHFDVIASQTEIQATLHTKAIMLELQENPRIIQDFGELKTDEWSDGQFVTKNNCMILARGLGQRIRGLRFRQHRIERLIFDDMEDEEVAINPKRVKKTIDWIRRGMAAGKKGGAKLPVSITGTVITKRCVMGTILFSDEFKAWRRRIYPAITREGRPLWPERYSMADLDNIKSKVGSRAFAAEYQNQPHDDEGAFQEAWIQYYHPNELQGRDMKVVSFIDAAVKTGENNCFSAIITAGIGADGIIYVLNARIRKLPPYELCLLAYSVHEDYHPMLMGMEVVAFQALFFDLLDSIGKERGHHLPIRGTEQKENKETRIQGLSAPVERGKIRFPSVPSGDISLLIEQLLGFPDGDTDGPDALEGAVRLLRRATARMEYQVVEGRRYAGKGW